MVASIARIRSALNLFVHAILTCWCCSQIFELRHIFKGPVRYLYALLLSCLIFPSLNEGMMWAKVKKTGLLVENLLESVDLSD
jgi:hypothetical protein